MAGFIFEGQVESLSSRQQEFICNVVEKLGYKNNNINIEEVGKAGDNYIANVKRIIINNNGENFKMIAKIAPTNKIARARSGIDVVFINESIMYQEILPTLVNLQKVHDVPKEDLFRYAKCYGVLTEAPHEMILLEDLKISGFVTLNRFTSLTNEYVKLVLKNFAIFHSLSLYLKEQNPEIFSKYCKRLIDFFVKLSESHDFRYYLENIEKDALEVLDEEKYKDVVRGSISKMPEKLANIAKDVLQMKQSVLIQGDGWTNNIMFQIQDENPVSCVLIDYQLSKMSNPVCDILYMIFACTDHVTRQKYYNEWIDYYYLKLEESLSHFGIEVNNIYTRSELNDDLKKYSKLFFDNSLMLFSIFIRKSEDAAKVKKAIEEGEKYENMLETFQMSNLDMESLSLFKSKIEGLIDSFKEFGYID